MPPIWKPASKETLRHYIETVLDEASDDLNDWETKFIENVDRITQIGGSLSKKQEEILERIYAEKTK